MEKLIVLFHFIIFVFGTFYAFLFKKSWVDNYYLIFNYMTALSWTLFKGECIISLFLKKYKDHHYKIGDDVSADDLSVMFGEKYKPILKYLFTPVMIVQAYSIYLVLKRNNMNPWCEFIFIIYLLGLKCTQDVLYQGVFFILFLMISIKIIHKLWN